MLDTERPEQFRGLSFSCRCGYTQHVNGRESHVAQDRHVIEQVMELEHETDLPS